MENIYRNNFRYIATRYEEWQAGMCISKGNIDAEIVAEVINDEVIRFKIEDADDLRIVKNFQFELMDPVSESLPGRIQYIHSTNDFNPIVPMVCHIFHNDDNQIKYVRFAMTNPDRLIEFYGYTAEINQPSRMAQPQKSDYRKTTAQSIIEELRGSGQYETGALFERAVKLFWDNADVSDEEQVRLIIEAHKLFVSAFHLAYDENEKEGRDSEPMYIPKIYLFLAYCNYKLGNVSAAYYIATKAYESLEKVLKTSVLAGEGFRQAIGGKMIDDFLEFLKKDYRKEIDETMPEIDPLTLNLEKSKQLGKINKDNIKLLIETIIKISNDLSKYADAQRNNDIAFRTFKFTQMLEVFTYPLLKAWELYNFGWHTDFWEEGHSMFQYMMYEMKAKETTQQLLESLKEGQSPFVKFENNGAITKGLIAVYSYMLKDLD